MSDPFTRAKVRSSVQVVDDLNARIAELEDALAEAKTDARSLQADRDYWKRRAKPIAADVRRLGITRAQATTYMRARFEWNHSDRCWVFHREIVDEPKWRGWNDEDAIAVLAIDAAGALDQDWWWVLDGMAKVQVEQGSVS